MTHYPLSETIELSNLKHFRCNLYAELDNIINVTRARRIQINMELDRIANREKKLMGILIE